MKDPKHLSAKLSERHESDSLRSLSTETNLIDFYSNDYLGLARNRNVHNAVLNELKGVDRINGSTGSRLISGNSNVHEDLESSLAQFFSSKSALLYQSGYDANVGLLSAVIRRHDTVFYDALCHASIRDGLKLTSAKCIGFKHNDLDDLRKKIRNVGAVKGNQYLIVESVYSMDGDEAPLQALVELAEKHGLFLIVDEAHAVGVFGKGRGLVSELELEDRVFARVPTFGKGLGCHGAAVLGSVDLKKYLINFSRSFIYTTAPSVHSVLTIKQALIELADSRELSKLHKNICLFKDEIRRLELEHLFIESRSSIQVCLINPHAKTKSIAASLRENNFAVKAVLSPTVREGQERLRFCVHSFNTSTQIKEILFLLSTFV